MKLPNSLSILLIISLSIIGLLQYKNLQELANETDIERLMGPDVSIRSSEVDTERLNLRRYLPAFGFRNILSNWTFINFLIYFGDDELRAQTDYQLSPEFFEIIVDLDPYFIDSYLFLTGSTTLYAGQPERSVELVERGLNSLGPNKPPRSYLVWRYKATDELLFLGQTEAAKESYEAAADWAKQSSDLEATYIGETSRQTVTFLAKNPDSKSAQITAWFTIFASGFDEQAQTLARQRIEALGGVIEVLPNGAIQVRTKE